LWRDPTTNQGKITPRNWISGTRFLARERVKVKRAFQPGDVFRLRLRQINPEQILALDVNRCVAQFGRGEDVDSAVLGVGRSADCKRGRTLWRSLEVRSIRLDHG
jgi:hypothetical protein